MSRNSYYQTCEVMGLILRDVIEAHPDLAPQEIACRAWDIAHASVELALAKAHAIDPEPTTAEVGSC